MFRVAHSSRPHRDEWEPRKLLPKSPNGSLILSAIRPPKPPPPARSSPLRGLTLAVSAHALERVTLRNGFSYDCARREAVDTNHVRLYLADETGSSTNFIDLPATAIATVEPLPDPPKPTRP
jgi:hypothetical protein